MIWVRVQGILSFIISKVTKKKIISIDSDFESEKCFYRNAKLNNVNFYRFYRCNGFNSKYLRNQKFNLIVSNILLRPLKKLVKNFKNHLSKSGYLILSGILNSQKNDIISLYRKFNLKLIKCIYIEDWVSLIFKNYDKDK